MKKFIFGCVLMLGGIFGGTGWVLSRAVMASSRGWDSLAHLFSFGLDNWWTERFFITVFYLIAAIGAVIMIKALKEDR